MLRSNDLPAADEPLPFQPVIVTGVPRSGTHLLHSMICTSQRTNPFVPEYHYFYFMLEAYLRTLKIFNPAQAAGFASKDALVRHHFALMRLSLIEAWDQLGRPEMLVMKHCSITPVIPVLARRFPTMKFVVIQRDARDSIASEVRAARKGDPEIENVEQTIEEGIERYRLYYGSVLRAMTSLRDRIKLVQYERLAQGEGIRELGAFLGIDDIAPDMLWQRANFAIGKFDHFKVFSDLWGQPLSSANIGRYRETLDEETTGKIHDRTETVMMRFAAVEQESRELSAS